MDPVFLDNLRRSMVAQNIFGTPTSAPASPMAPQGDVPNMASQGVPPSMPEQEEAPYTPDQEIMDAYKQSLLKGEPTRPEHGLPFKLLAGGLSGLANFKQPQNTLPTYNSVVEGNYGNDLAQWKQKVDALRLGASLENQTNVNTRTQVHQERQDKIANRKVDVSLQESERKRSDAEANRAIAQQRADTAQQRADVYKEVSKGGQIIADDVTGKVYLVYKDGTKKDIDITKMTPADKEEMLQEGRFNLEKERQAGRSQLEGQRQQGREELEGTRQTNRETLEDKRISGRVEVKKTPAAPKAGTGTTKEELPTQTRIRIYNNALAAKNKNSDWAKWINVDNTNKAVTVTPSKKGMLMNSGPDPKMREEIIKAIYPDGKETGGGEVQATIPPKNPKPGDKFTWPNGKTGVWDGKGWALENATAK